MKKINILLFAVILGLSGCTENVRARAWGGTAKQVLPANRKLVNVTWKDVNLWILTRPMNSNDVAETYSLKESSSLGIVQGEVIIVEVKP